jgi:hypothetical protein
MDLHAFIEKNADFITFWTDTSAARYGPCERFGCDPDTDFFPRIELFVK